MPKYNQSDLRAIHEEMKGCVAAFVSVDDVVGGLDKPGVVEQIEPICEEQTEVNGIDGKVVSTVLAIAICDARSEAMFGGDSPRAVLYDYDHS